MSELNLSKVGIGKCCSNKSVYRITYKIGTRWLVCNECLEIDYFKSGIEKMIRK